MAISGRPAEPAVEQDGGWEGETPAGGRRWYAVAVVLLLVVGAAVAVRPSAPPADLEVLPGEPDAVPTAPPAPAPPRVAVVHALNTFGLGVRVPPVELPLGGRVLRSAVSSRGRQLLAIGLEDPLTGSADVHVRDSSGLSIVAWFEDVPGPLEHLTVSEDGRAVVWAQPGSDEEGPRVWRYGRDGTRELLETERGFEVRDVRGLRDGRLVALGRGPGDPPGSLRVVSAQVDPEDGVLALVADVRVDVGEDGAGVVEGTTVARPRAAHVWDDRRLRLHLVSAARDAVMSVDLRTGETRERAEGERLAGVGQREAELVPDADAVVATGSLVRFPGAGLAPDVVRPLDRAAATGDGRPGRVPLEPLLFGTAWGGDGIDERFARGDAVDGRVRAAAPDLAVVTAPAYRRGGQTGTEVRVVDLEFDPIWTTTVAGEVTAAHINYQQTHVTLAREIGGGTVLTQHALADDGRPAVERRYAPGAVVHPTAVVVIEQR